MIDRDTVIAKVTNIQNCLSRIQRVTEPPQASLHDDFMVQDVVVLNLQRAVQTIIDIAAHIVASENYGVPQTQKELFRMLQREGVIDSEISAAMQKMVGFRNIAVHDYSAIDPMILQAIIDSHLGELEVFYTQILQHFKVV